ncbi:hypothetical protein S245_066911 [Arachis hypogaea]
MPLSLPTVAPFTGTAYRSAAVAPLLLLLSVAAVAPPTLVLLRSLSIELTRTRFQGIDSTEELFLLSSPLFPEIFFNQLENVQ